MNPSTIDLKLLFGEEKIVESSAAQQEIFSASLSDPTASVGYNHSISIFFEGALDRDALYSCLLNLLDRHEALRGRFSLDGTQFIVRERIGFELPVLDLSQLKEDDQQNHYQNYIQQELDYVFDLVEGPLFRSTLIKYSDQKWTLVFNCHHAVVDGWSLKIILDDLPKLYSALVKNTEETGLDQASSFTEYLKTAVAKEKESLQVVRQYWKSVYQDGVPVLELPVDHPRPRFRTYRSKREDYKIDRKIYNRIKEAGAKNGTSQFVTLLSAFSLFLSRISNQEDVVVGVPAAGQIKSGKSKLLGHDARMMPIRCTVKDNENFRTFSKRIMEHFFSAYDHQWVSMPDLMRELNIKPDPARVPFVSVMFNFDPGMDMADFHFEGLKSSFFFNHRNAETFEISINSVVDEEDLILECAYNSDLFDSNQIHLRLQQFEQLLSSISEHPETAVSQLELLPKRQILTMDAELNSTKMNYDRGLCVDQMIQKIAESLPSSIAVEFQDNALNYNELWKKSGQIANAIIAQKIGAKPLIGVMLERSESMVPVLLGVWRAGGGFVPMDPEYPLDRLQYMVEQSDIQLILTQKSLIDSLQMDGLQYQDVEEIFENEKTDLAPIAGRSSEDIAYVIYTSGSTGKPKGVQVPHRALNNFLHTMKTQSPGISPDDRVLGITTLSFDIAELELWLPLIAGARTVIVDRATAIDGQALIEVIRDKKINFMQATPATWRLLLFSEWEGDKRITALCGGEALPKDLANELLKRVGVLWNVYGPTETTVWSTLDRVSEDAITIGKPIGNTQAYILDAHLNWVPRGSVGELWLGGDGVTHGYLGRPDLTQERFVKNPFTGNGKMYKTGDLVRLRLDGRIEYVGRNDFQVKVRGYRIELGEVQHALSKHPMIRQSIVVVKERSPGDAHLVAYYAPKSGHKVSIQEIKDTMSESVPDYMLPTIFVELPHLPLTQNGKINIKELPNPFLAQQKEEPKTGASILKKIEETLSQHPWVQKVALIGPCGKNPDARPIAYVVPRENEEVSLIVIRKHLRHLQLEERWIPGLVVNLSSLPLRADGQVDHSTLTQAIHEYGVDINTASSTQQNLDPDAPQSPNEILLAQIWNELLGSPVKITTRDNFFSLGGHSLLSIQMIARVQKQTGYRLNPRMVLLNPLGRLARQLPSSQESIA